MPRFARRHHRRRGTKKRGLRRTGFTLIETMVVVGIIGAIASIIVPTAINPAKNLSDAFAVQRSTDAATLNTAFNVYYINHSLFPDQGKIPEDPTQWVHICRQGVAHASCLDASELLKEELAAIPLDPLEASRGCLEWSGFVAHRVAGGIGIRQMEVKSRHQGKGMGDPVDNTDCPSQSSDTSSSEE